MSSACEFRRTILIGLGGAGQQICTHMKRFFMDTYNIVPPSIRILCLDTDAVPCASRSAKSQKEYHLDEREFLHIVLENPADFIENDAVVRSWFISPVPHGAITNGAGAIRQVGRLALFANLNRIDRLLDNIVTELHEVSLGHKMEHAASDLGASTNFMLAERRMEVYVCGSLAGGTGSGTFLDMGILLRRKLPKAIIQGFFLLDWIYRNKSFAKRVRGNVYAALSELDYLQSSMFGKNTRPYKISYLGEEVPIHAQPYSLTHLIDGRNENGQNLREVKDVCTTAADAMFLSMGSMGGPVASVVDNLLAHINTANPRIWRGKAARYSSFGVSSLYYPAEEMHRIVSAQNALALVNEAMARVGPTATPADSREPDAADASSFMRTALNCQRAFVKEKLVPSRPETSFFVENFEISDPDFPSLLQSRQAKEEQDVKIGLKKQRDESQGFVDDCIAAIRTKVAALRANRSLGGAYLKHWMGEALLYIEDLEDQAGQDINRISAGVSSQRSVAAGCLDTAGMARWLPLLGGARKGRTLEYATEVEGLLQRIVDLEMVQHEKDFYTSMKSCLVAAMPTRVPAAGDTLQALGEARDIIQAGLRREWANMEILRNRPTQTLIGNGSILVLPGTTPDLKPLDSAILDYQRFIGEQGIHNEVDDYLAQYDTDAPEGKKAEKLAGLFLVYSANKLASVRQVDIYSAMETMGAARGDMEKFMKDQIAALFARAAAMWSYEKGRIATIQTLEYDRIVSFGVFDKTEGEAKLGAYTNAVKAKNGLVSDHSYSTTGDPRRIWLLNFAAALPVCFLSGLDNTRKKYQEEISPTYHIDSFFELNVPDLFPQDELRNRTLRILGMAIIPGIDVITDEKLARGHKFTLDLLEVRDLNFNEPRVWFLFRDMLSELVDSYDERAENNLLDIVTKELKAKVASLDGDTLKQRIEIHIAHLEDKMRRRDFTRLISARLTHHEIVELRKFLDPREYARDISRYIIGS